MAALAAEEAEEEAEEEEDCPKTEGLFGLKLFKFGLFGKKPPNEELSEFDEELLEADEDDELLPEELEVPANTALLGSWLGNGLFGLKLFKFGLF